MMRRFTVLLVVALLGSLIAASSSFAADEKAITVLVDGKQVAFTTAPFIESGTTLVPFRTIFEKLGLEINWDSATKTAIGTKEGLSISLQIGNSTAIVNGKEKSLTVAPKIVNNETFIPLRFVSENAEKEVSWDGISKEVYIADTNLQIIHLFEKHYAYTLEENLAGVMSTVDPNSPLYAQTEAVLGQMFAIYDLDRVNTTEVLEVQDSQAIVKTITTTTKINGPEFPVQKVISTNIVNKVNGQWEIYFTTPDYIDMLIADSIVEGEVTITKAEQDAILAVIEQSRVNTETEDWDAELLLYTSDFPNLQMGFEQSKQLGAVYDFANEITKQKILNAANDTAVIYYESALKRKSGPEFRDFNAGYKVTFKKVEGKWLFAKSDIVFIDYNLDTATTEAPASEAK
jgi:hypothetical protein